MKTTIEWKRKNEELPKKSGMYLVACCNADGVPYYIINSNFSTKHNMFNAYDREDKPSPTTLQENCTWWAELPNFKGE